jgi:phosphatidylinositol-specific phospholipase C-like protein
MDELIPHTSWMRGIPDDAPLATLNIPGTHNSCSVDGPLGFAKTQDRDLSDQLNAGIRFFDIRLAHYQDNLCVHHDVVCMQRSYGDVLTILSDFLGQYPSETIVPSISNEDRFDSALGKFAPSQALCKLSPMGSKNNSGENTRSFEATLKARTSETIGDAPLFYNFGHTSPALTPETRLANSAEKSSCCADSKPAKTSTYWPEGQRFRSAAPPFL